jgi:hypothetical protein
MSEHLTVAEFERSQRALHRVIAQGFDRMDKRFDGLTDEQSTHAERLAVLEATKKTETKKSAAWTGVIATVVVGIIEGIRQLASRP